jgi:phage portal protein BeeE
MASMVGFWQQPGQPQVDAEGLRDTVEVNSDIGRASGVVSRDTARPHLILLDTSGDEPVEVPLEENHPAMMPFRYPNPGTTSEQYRGAWLYDLQIEGNSFNWLDLRPDPRPGRDRLVPHGMWRMPPEKVKVHPGKQPGEYLDHYEFVKFGESSPDNPTYRPFEVFHIKTYHPTDPYRGLGIIPLLRHEILISRYSKKWRENFFKNGVPATLLLEAQGEFKENKPKNEDLARMSDAIFYGMTGVDGERIGRPLINWGDFKATPIPRPKEEDVAWIKTQGWTKAETGKAFGVPPTKMMDYTGQQLSSNAEQQEHDYWVDTIQGWNRLILAYLNDRFLRVYYPDESLEFAWDYSEILALAPSRKVTSEWTTALAREGLIAGIEARRLNNVPDPDPEMVQNADALYKLRYNGRPLDLFDSGLDNLLLPGSSPGGDSGDGGGGDGGGGDGGGTDPGDQGGQGEEEQDDLEQRGRFLTEEEFQRVFRKFTKPTQLVTKDMADDLFAGVRETLETHAQRVRRLLSRMVALSGQQEVELDGLPNPFSITDPRALAAVAEQATRVTGLVATSDLATLRVSIASAIESGAPIGSKEVRDAIQRAFRSRRKAWQLDRIALTEAHQSREIGSVEAMRQNDIERHEWLTSQNENVRGAPTAPPSPASHYRMHQQNVEVGQPFTDPVSGARMLHPGDTSLGAGASDVINCHCTTAAIFEGEEAEKYAGRVVRLADMKAATLPAMQRALRELFRRNNLALERAALAAYDELYALEGAGV